MIWPVSHFVSALLSYLCRPRIDGSQTCRRRWDCKCRSRASRCSCCSKATTWCIFALSFPCTGTIGTHSRLRGQTPPWPRRQPCSLPTSSSRGRISSDLQTEFAKSQGGKEELHAGTRKHKLGTNRPGISGMIFRTREIVVRARNLSRCRNIPRYLKHRYKTFPFVFIFISAILVWLFTPSEGK